MSQPASESQLVAPNDLSYLPVIGAYMRAVAERAGFDQQDGHRIRLAVDEACTAVIESFEPDDAQTFTITCRLDATSLTITLADKGLPRDPGTLQVYNAAGGLERDTAGLSYFLIRQIMDQVRYSIKGWAGNETQLVKYLVSPDVASYFTPTDLQPYEPTVAPPDAPISYRLMRPAEAARVAQCVYRTYGYTYPSEHLYYPARLAEMNHTGELISAVAVIDSGEVVGHCALTGEPGAPIMEIGQAIVSPPYRSHGIIAQLAALLLQEARARGLKGLYSLPVTVHPYSQQAAHKIGFRDTGLLLGYVPQSVLFKKIGDQKLAQRETLFYSFMPLDMPDLLPVYAPPHHRAMIQRLYDHAGLRRRVLVATDAALPDAPSNLDTHIKPSFGSAQIQVLGYGRHVVRDTSAQLADLQDRGLAVIHLDLPLSDPLTSRLGAELEALGLGFGAVLPGVAGDWLRLQHLHQTAIDYAQITCASDVGRALLDYVRRAMESVP